MEFNEIYNTLLLVGGVLMFIMSFLLWYSPKGLFPNRVLAGLILAWGFCVIIFATQSRELFLKFPHLLGLGSTVTFLFFPLMYIYVKSYLFEKHRNVLKYGIHALPILIFSGFLAPFYFQSSEAKISLINNGLYEGFYFLIDMGAVSVIILGILYTVKSFRLIYNFEEEHQGSLEEGQLVALNWLKQFLAINTLFWAIGSSAVLIESIGLNIPFDLFKTYYLGITLLVLGASIFNIFNPDFFAIKTKIKFSETEDFISEKRKPAKLLANHVMSKVADDNPLDKSEAKIILEYLEIEKPYLNTSITLQDLADETSMSKHRVSELLNSQLGASFYDIINEYRVKEVIRLINEGKHEQHKLIHLAELAGFNSKATFNRIFKKVTNRTPSQYIQEIAA